jgi:uncharacterized DUF497 family protein
MELGDLRVTYVGGPTALFEIERLRLLTDPTFDPAGDPRKAEANAAKHGVSFEDAVTVFLDPEAFDGPDRQHSSAESRFLRLGRSAGGHVLMVAYTIQEKWRCGSDPDHQRAAGEPPRACGVRGDRLIFMIFPIHP